MAPISESLKRTITDLADEVRRDPATLRFVELAAALCRARRFGDAARICRKGLGHHPDRPEGLVELGRALFGQGDLQGAAEALRRVLKLDGATAEALRLSGEVMLAAGRAEDVAPLVRRAAGQGVVGPSLDRLVQRAEAQLLDKTRRDPRAMAHEPWGERSPDEALWDKIGSAWDQHLRQAPLTDLTPTPTPVPVTIPLAPLTDPFSPARPKPPQVVATAAHQQPSEGDFNRLAREQPPLSAPVSHEPDLPDRELTVPYVPRPADTPQPDERLPGPLEPLPNSADITLPLRPPLPGDDEPDHGEHHEPAPAAGPLEPEFDTADTTLPLRRPPDRDDEPDDVEEPGPTPDVDATRPLSRGGEPGATDGEPMFEPAGPPPDPTPLSVTPSNEPVGLPRGAAPTEVLPTPHFEPLPARPAASRGRGRAVLAGLFLVLALLGFGWLGWKAFGVLYPDLPDEPDETVNSLSRPEEAE